MPRLRSESMTAAFAQRMPLSVDMPGLLYVEALARIRKASARISELNNVLKRHSDRVLRARAHKDPDASDDAWVDIVQRVGSVEPLFGRLIRELAVADVLLVAAAESYINAVASHVLSGSEAGVFDGLSPVGKWLFLPRLMKLSWRPELGGPPLQQFAALVARRNKVVHPRPVRVAGTSEVGEFIRLLKLDSESAAAGAASVNDLIRALSLSWRGSSGPDWLSPERARRRPPCFVVGPVDAPGRLGRKRSAKRDDA